MKEEKLSLIRSNIKNKEDIFTAIGDSTRLHIIHTLLKLDCTGVRVGEITKNTNLSRPAVSHHLKILKDVGFINMRREGTKNYYYLDKNIETLKEIKSFFELIIDYVENYYNEVKNDK